MEQLLRAHESSDLGEGIECHGDVDWLRAAGAVGQNGRHRLALAVWRLTEEGDKRALYECYDGMVREVVAVGVLSNPVHVVANVLQWMVAPRCKCCQGRGHPVIAGTPTLSDQVCPDCNGTGDAVPHWGDHERALYEKVRDLQRQAAAAIAKKMRDG